MSLNEFGKSACDVRWEYPVDDATDVDNSPNGFCGGFLLGFDVSLPELLSAGLWMLAHPIWRFHPVGRQPVTSGFGFDNLMSGLLQKTQPPELGEIPVDGGASTFEMFGQNVLLNRNFEGSVLILYSP